MQQNELEPPKPLVPSQAAIGVSELDRRIVQLNKSKSLRSGLIVVGVIITCLWLVGYVAATAGSNANPASVAILGPILTSPLLFLGITMVIVGVVGRNNIKRQIEDAERTREILVASLGTPEEEEKPAPSEVH